jgi:peptidoglycan/LPS O-acetylase OafA/YrhL
METTSIQARIVDMGAERAERRIGQFVGAVVVICALGAAAYIGVQGGSPWSPGAASAIGGIPLVGLVIAFMSGKKRDEKKEE